MVYARIRSPSSPHLLFQSPVTASTVLEANCTGKKQEKDANNETQSATNEKREIALE
jgi:hypothetical protein